MSSHYYFFDVRAVKKFIVSFIQPCKGLCRVILVLQFIQKENNIFVGRLFGHIFKYRGRSAYILALCAIGIIFYSLVFNAGFSDFCHLLRFEEFSYVFFFSSYFTQKSNARKYIIRVIDSVGNKRINRILSVFRNNHLPVFKVNLLCIIL